MKKMGFESIFNGLYAAIFGRETVETWSSDDRTINFYRLVSVSYVSRISLVALLLLFIGGFTTEVWGAERTFKATCSVSSNPLEAGWVYVAKNAQTDWPRDRHDDSSSPSYTDKRLIANNLAESHKFDFYGYQEVAIPGYTFKGWASSASDNSGSTSTSDHYDWFTNYPYYPFSITVSGTSGTNSNSATYYAIYAGILSTSNTTSGLLSYGNVNVGSTKEMTFVFKHAHAGKITGAITGSHKDDFTLKTSLPTNSTTQANCTITVAFKPTCGDTRLATLTLTGNNGGSMSITLSGTGVRHTPSISTTNGSVNVSVGTPVTTTNLNDRVTCDNTEGAKTYSKANNADPVTISGNSFSATKAGTYTVNVSVAQTCYYTSQNSSFEITVNRVSSSISMNDGAVNVSIEEINSSTLDLSTLLKSKTGNGDITYKVQSATGKNATTLTASIAADGKTFSATECGTYTIRATQAQTDQYNSSYDDFTVTVNKLQPTFTWKSFDHIYAGALLANLAQAQYNDANVAGLTYTYSSNNLIAAVPVESNTKISVPTTGFTTNQNVRISVTTAETDYYMGGSSYEDYLIEPKATPVFMLNGDTLQESPVKELVLYIGETATMRFVNTDESNNRFKYPTSPLYVSYAHNSESHTGVITAERFGDEGIQFDQEGTTTIFKHTRSIHVYVKKHEVSLSTGLDGITCEVGDSVETGGVYSLSVTPAEGQPAQKDVIIRSDNEEAVKFADGKWRAVGEGTAVLTIAQDNNDFWTGDTITATITVNKKTPTITWHLEDSYPWGSIIKVPVTSSNEELPFTVVSSNKSIAEYVDGHIYVYNKTGDVTFTLTQAGNYKWNAAASNLTKTINCFKPQNHVPFTLDNNNNGHFYNTKSGDASWNSYGYRLGDNGWSAQTDEVVIRFSGVPDKLKFDKVFSKTGGFLPKTHYCAIYESADGKNWSGAIWERDVEEETLNNQVVPLSPSTQFVKFHYHGTLYCYYKNISVTERKEVTAPASVGYGSSYVGNAATEKTIDVNWYNVKTCTVALSGANADCFELLDHSIASTLDNYGTASLRVNYKHDVIGSHTATLTITSADSPAKTATVTLTGETKKAIQSIIWREDITPLPLDEPYAGAALATSGLTVTLDAETPGIVNIEGDQITGVGVGTTRLFAYQAGDTKWEAVRDTVTIEVTNKHVQHIIWTDKLSNVKRENGKTVTINLTAYSDADASLPVTYELDDDARAFASVNGNVLSVTAWGTGYITARQAGNDEYVGVSKTMKLVSRDPNADCKPLVLDEAGVKTLHTIDSEEFTLQGEPATIEFDAKVNQFSALYGIWVGEYYGGSWHEVKQVSRYDMSQNYQHFGPYDLHINATKVKIYTETGTTWQRDFKNVEVTLARYLRLKENNMDFSHVEYGQVVEQQFVIDYSNLAGTLEVSLKKASAQFEILTETVGEDCGEINHNAVVRVRFTGHNLGTESNTIVLKNKNQTLEVPVSATVVPASQLITWNDPSPAEILTTADVTLTATATSSLPVSFESSDNSIAEPYAKGDGTYGLTVHTSGNITITAKQTGNDRYNAAQDVVHAYSISKAEPVIKTLPTAAEMVLPDTKLSDCVLSGGVASVPGTFAWEDDSQYATQGNVGYKVVFTPENTNWYDTASCVVVVPVSQAPQTITWNFDQLEMYCNTDYTFDAAASSGLKVIYQTSDASIAYVNDANHLNIIKGGVVTITAIQEGNGTYVAAEPVSKTLTIKRFAPAIVTQPDASSMMIGRLLSDASLVGGRAELNGGAVEGSFSWVDGNNTVMNVAGTFSKQIVFTPANTNYYEPVEGVLDVVVEKYAPEIVQTLHGATITYGQTLSESALSGTLTATDNVKIPSEEVEGTYAWLQPATRLPAGTHQATVRFTPTNQNWYEAVDFPVQLTVNKASAAGLTVSGTSEIFYGQILGEAVPVNTTVDPVHGGVVAGTMAWDASLDMNDYKGIGTYDLPVTLTVNDPNYTAATLTGTAVLTVRSGFAFMGTNGTTWGDDGNWAGQEGIPGENDPVLIMHDVVINGDITVEAMTIRQGVTVTVEDGGSLMVKNGDAVQRNAYGNLIVESGGEMEVENGTMHVRDFTLRAKLSDGENPGKSGQVHNPSRLDVVGNAYFDLALDPSGSCSYGWYDFTVPFPVDAQTGVSRFKNDTHEEVAIRCEVNYAIMDFSESRRIETGYGWKKFHSVMQPGKCYSITIDDYDNVYRFKKTAGSSFNSPMSEILAYTDTDNEVRGWNGLGNGTMAYANLSAVGIDKVQLYSHVTNSYTAVRMSDYTYVVGSAYFVQAPSADAKISYVHNGENHELRAPKREVDEVSEFALSLGNEYATVDRLYVSADEDASESYEIGRDLTKFGTPSESKVAQVWAKAYNGMKLCDIEMLLENQYAACDLGLYAPQEGNYILSIDEAPEDATLYLTYNGRVIWNLTYSPYTLDLAKGTTEGYGLKLYVNRIATDIDEVQGNNVQCTKVIMDNQIYIIMPNGAMYDVTGKKVQ